MKKFKRQIVSNKQNVALLHSSIPNPPQPKPTKFGKIIRDKALQSRNHQASHPNIQRRHNSTIQSDIIPQKTKKLSFSIMDNDSEIDGSFMPEQKAKSVRFSNLDQSDSASMVKSVRRTSSILKNNQSFDKLSMNSINSHIGQIGGGLSAKASLKDKGICCQNKKYETQLKVLEKNNKKYFDDLFPPGSSSLFYSKTKAEQYKDIKWVRADEVFRGKKIVLWGDGKRNIVLEGQFENLNYMSVCFNAIRQSKRCMERIFENQCYNKYGIYYLRLNHEGIWKYVVIDDYIPVRKHGKDVVPVFNNIKPSKSNYFELWPFLLQKAIAKMYACYEALMNDSVISFIQQLTGIVPETVHPQEPSFEFKVRNNFNYDNIIVGKTNSQPNEYYVITEDKPLNTYFSQESWVKVIGSSLSFDANLEINEVKKKFDLLYLYKVEDTYFSVGCIIKQQKNTISLRKFKINCPTTCILSLIQKDQKYYRNSGYEYSWMRLILVMKDIDGYRWIDGHYGNTKIVSLNCSLNEGEYYVLVMGDWKKKVYDLSLNYQGNCEIEFERQAIAKYPRIIEEVGIDLSQRFGTFKQMSKNICSYQYIDIQNGLIIENFNNECDRRVYVQKIYKLTEDIVSIGAQFSQKGELESFINSGQSLTVVLKFTNGINYSFLNKFHFQ